MRLPRTTAVAVKRDLSRVSIADSPTSTGGGMGSKRRAASGLTGGANDPWFAKRVKKDRAKKKAAKKQRRSK